MHQINPVNLKQKNWVEINDESRGIYNVNRQIKFKTTMLESSLCDYSNAYIFVKGKIIIGAGDHLHKQQLDKQMKEIRVWHLKIVLHSLIA